MAHSTFPPRFKQIFAFQPFRLFHYSFWDNSNSVSLCFGLSVYKWSPVYAALVRILHWQTARSKCLNEGMLILSDLELHTLLYVATVTAISWLPEYWLLYSSKFWWGEIFQILTANTWWKIFWWIVTVFHRAPVNGVLFLNNLTG